MPRNNVSSYSRREWLRSAVAIAGSTIASGPLLAQPSIKPSLSSLRLGLVTYNWGKDWDVPTLIANCTETGFEGIELRTTHKHGVEISLNAEQREEVTKRFADSDVILVGLGSACEYHSDDPTVVKKNIEETKEFIRLCHDVGGSGVKVRPNGIPKGGSIEKTLTQIGESLNEVARYGAGFGVQIRLEVHGKVTCELPHIKTIMDVADHPNNVICWNCNGEDLKGAGFAKNYDLVKDRMGTVHIHDLRNNSYPWQDFFERLLVCDAPGFTGWTLMEEGSTPDGILDIMRENRKIWERLAKA
jgi:sugar phosphate isomerase/epimerase